MATLKEQKAKRKKLWIKRLGAHVKKLRLERGLTGEDFGVRIGVYKQHVSSLERGEANPTAFRLKEICAALEISMADFFDSLGE